MTNADPLGHFALRTAHEVTLGWWPALAALGVEAAVTTRHGGVSTGPYHSLNLALHVGDDPAAVAENRRRAALAFGCEAGDLVFAQQVHGAGVAVVNRADRGRGLDDAEGALPEVDALITTDPSVVLVTMVADCVPILLFDAEARALASVHAGWRGTVAGVCGAALDALEALGADAGRVVAALGPAIPASRYQVGPEVAEAVRAALGPAADGVLAADGDGGSDRWRLDLHRANRALLERRGVARERIVAAPLGTGDDGPFYSDRAARPCGRFALLARLHPYDGGPAVS